MLRVVNFENDIVSIAYTEEGTGSSEDIMTLDIPYAELCQNKSLLVPVDFTEYHFGITDICGITETTDGYSVTVLPTIEDAVAFSIKQCKDNGFDVVIRITHYREDSADEDDIADIVLESVSGESSDTFVVPPCVSTIMDKAFKDYKGSEVVLRNTLSGGFSDKIFAESSVVKVVLPEESELGVTEEELERMLEK